MESKQIRKFVDHLLKHTTMPQTEHGVKIKDLMHMINRMHVRCVEEIYNEHELIDAISNTRKYKIKGKYIKVAK